MRRFKKRKVHSSFTDNISGTDLADQVLYYTLKKLSNTEKVVSWKSKALSVKKFAIPTITDNSFSPSVNWFGD